MEGCNEMHKVNMLAVADLFCASKTSREIKFDTYVIRFIMDTKHTHAHKYRHKRVAQGVGVGAHLNFSGTLN